VRGTALAGGPSKARMRIPNHRSGRDRRDLWGPSDVLI
jgi:hypothetical protein